MALGDVVQGINEQYPYFGFLLADPEVGPLLTRAVDPASMFSPTRFQAELMNTSWFRNRSAAARQWEILVNTDPAEAWRRRAETYYQQSEIAHRLGYMLSEPELQFMAEWNLNRGIEPGSAEWNWGLRTIINNQLGSPGRIVQGAIVGNADNIAALAKGDFFVNPTIDDVYRTAIDVSMGYLDQNAVRQKYANMAASLYPHLNPMIQQGATVRDIMSQHLQTVADEWETTPDQLTFDSPIVQSLISRWDLDKSKMRTASLYEAKTMARRDDRFWQTQKAKQLESSAGSYLLQTFGKVA